MPKGYIATTTHTSKYRAWWRAYHKLKAELRVLSEYERLRLRHEKYLATVNHQIN
jgi:hypothetical protein